jgi:hypothetical protein
MKSKALFLVTMRGGSHYMAQLLSGIPLLNLEEPRQVWVATTPPCICPMCRPADVEIAPLMHDWSGCSGLSHEVYISYIADGPPAPYHTWPYHGLAWTPEDISRLGPNWTIVRSLRDGRNQIASHKKLDESEHPAWTREEYISRCLAFRYRALSSLGSIHLPNYKLIRFEDLALKPLETLEQLASFTGIPFDIHGKIASCLGDLRPHTSFTQKPFNPSEITERWRGLSHEERRILHDIAGAELTRLGYIQDDSWVNA